MRFLNIIIIVSLIIYSSALWAQEEYYDQKGKHEIAFQNEAQIRPFIQEYIGKLADGIPVKIEREKFFAPNVLLEFYKRIDYAPAWKDYDALRDAFEALKNSYQDGLFPQDYHMDGLYRIVEKIEELEKAIEPDYEWVAKFDILMSDAVLMYGYHLLEGKVDPHNLDVNWNYGYAKIPGNDGSVMERAIKDKNVSVVLHDLRPDLPGYPMLMNELEKYSDIAENGGWRSIPDGGKIDPGNSDSRIPAIKKRLMITGDLTDLADMESEIYSKGLEEDIRYFQARYGLDADGVIGKGTFAALNVPVKKRIEQIRVNLERFRWVGQNLPDNFIVVNIARFRAWVVQGSKIIHKTNVQVGSYYHKTPVFKSRLKYIEFNPTWTVPRSITINEMLPKIKKDHNYLQDRNMVFLDRDGGIVPFSSVDYDALSANNFPYVIRQEPGPGNALGEMKFIFPNKYSVYLHDTPSKYLFGKASRSFSHGCIRVQYPEKLAEVLLSGTEWDKQKIKSTLESRETTRAYFEEPIDVLLLYYTAGVYEGETVFYFPDIYGRDQKVLDKLNREVEAISSRKFKKMSSKN